MTKATVRSALAYFFDLAYPLHDYQLTLVFNEQGMFYHDEQPVLNEQTNASCAVRALCTELLFRSFPGLTEAYNGLPAEVIITVVRDDGENSIDGIVIKVEQYVQRSFIRSTTC